MPTWLRVTLLVVVLVWSIAAGIRMEARVQRRLVRAARGSVGRAFAVVAAYHLALVGVLAVCGVLAAAVASGAPVLAVVVMLVALAATSPFMWPLAPGQAGVAQSATAFRDLRRTGASKAVARAIAYPAAVCWFLLLVPAATGAVFGVLLT